LEKITRIYIKFRNIKNENSISYKFLFEKKNHFSPKNFAIFKAWSLQTKNQSFFIKQKISVSMQNQITLHLS